MTWHPSLASVFYDKRQAEHPMTAHIYKAYRIQIVLRKTWPYYSECIVGSMVRDEKNIQSWAGGLAVETE